MRATSTCSKALLVYKEVGYDGILMPDHVPAIQRDSGGRQAFAFAFGYVRGQMQAPGVQIKIT
jgi:mannonate dehydratase